MTYRARGRRGRGLVVNNGDGFDNFGNQNRYRNEIEELCTQIATLNDKVQLLLLKRQVATLIKKVHRLLPRGGIDNSNSQFKSSFDYKEDVSPNEFEEDVSLYSDVFDDEMKLGYSTDFPIFDEYPREDLLEGDCVFKIEDEFEDLLIYDDSPNEDFGGELDGIPVYDEYANDDLDDDDIPIFECETHEDVEDELVFGANGDLDGVPIYDNCEEELSVHIEDGRFVNMIEESFAMLKQGSEEAQEENGVGVLPKPEEVVFDVPLVLEDFIEPKLDSCFYEMPLELSMAQDVQVCVALVPHLATKLPKEGRVYLEHLEDPLGMVFTRENLGQLVKLNFLYVKVDDFCDVLEPSVVT